LPGADDRLVDHFRLGRTLTMIFKTLKISPRTLVSTSAGGASFALMLTAALSARGALPADEVEVDTVAGMPPVVNPRNVYSEMAPGHVQPALLLDLPRIYVPDLRSNALALALAGGPV
jgi:hypothetical protein